MENSRDNTIQAIKAALKARGLKYSVTGGRGTVWGWITIDLLPAAYKTSSGYSQDFQLEEMNKAFGLPRSARSISIPAGSKYYQEYIDRAAGREPSVVGVPYWD